MATATEELRLHEQIHIARRRKGITQGQLALELGVTQGTVSKWESPKSDVVPNVYQLRKIADITEDERLYDLRMLGSPWDDRTAGERVPADIAA